MINMEEVKEADNEYFCNLNFPGLGLGIDEVARKRARKWLEKCPNKSWNPEKNELVMGLLSQHVFS